MVVESADGVGSGPSSEKASGMTMDVRLRCGQNQRDAIAKAANKWILPAWHWPYLIAPDFTGRADRLTPALGLDDMEPNGVAWGWHS